MWAMPIPFWLILLFVLIEGLLGGSLQVIWMTTLSDSVDQYLRGRVSSLETMGSLFFIPLSPLLSGWLIEETSVLTTYSIAVSLMIIVTLPGLLVPPFRRFVRVDTEQFPIKANGDS